MLALFSKTGSGFRPIPSAGRPSQAQQQAALGAGDQGRAVPFSPAPDLPHWRGASRAQGVLDAGPSRPPSRESHNRMPKKKNPMHRSPWTKDDLRQIKAHSKARTPVSIVAKTMRRTEGAVRQKAKAIGIG